MSAYEDLQALLGQVEAGNVFAEGDALLSKVVEEARQTHRDAFLEQAAIGSMRE